MLRESANEEWPHFQRIINIKTQPTYALGFAHHAFSLERLKKVGNFFKSYYAGKTCAFGSTSFMYFPFFSCEIEESDYLCSMARLHNTHYVTIGMCAINELFRRVGRESELDGRVLAFSISHSRREVVIVAHYSLIDEQETKYYQKVIHSAEFASPHCTDRWIAYSFTRNLYNWMLNHCSWICSAVDKLEYGSDFPRVHQPLGQRKRIQSDMMLGISLKRFISPIWMRF
ncbi:hypothetical protein GGI42DRAFT_337719 [Trichoderma sp. SZMC 28013]